MLYIYNISAAQKLKKRVSISEDSCTLSQILKKIGQEIDLDFSLRTEKDFFIGSLCLNNRSAILILKELVSKFGLCFHEENDLIIIEADSEFWKIYDLPFGYYDSSGEKKDDFLGIFKMFSKNNCSLDLENKKIAIFGNRKTHNLVKKYLDDLVNPQQIIIECKFLEVKHKENEDLKVNYVIDWVTNSLKDLKFYNFKPGFYFLIDSVTDLLKNFIKMQPVKSEIKTTNTCYLKVMNNKNGVIRSGNKFFIRLKRSKPDKTSTLEKIHDGLSMKVTPQIFCNKIILNVKASLSAFSGKDTEKRIGQKSTHKIRSAFTIENGEIIILGGLKTQVYEKNGTILNKIPILNRLLNRSIKKEISNIIIVMKIYRDPSNPIKLLNDQISNDLSKIEQTIEDQ